MPAAGAIKEASAAACARKWWRSRLSTRGGAGLGLGNLGNRTRSRNEQPPPSGAQPSRRGGKRRPPGQRQATRTQPQPRGDDAKLLTIARKYQVFIYYVASKTNSKSIWSWRSR